MWLSPFISELLVFLDWQLRGVFTENFKNFVLGGNSFNDILFVLGFATLVSSGLFALTSKSATIDREREER